MKWTVPRLALFLAIALTIWLWPSILGGKVLLPLDVLAHNPPQTPTVGEPVHNALIADAIFENYGWKLYQRQSLAAGEWPLWNPYSFCGHPTYTTGQTSTFYPLNVIFWLVPLPYAYVVYTWLHLFAGGLFMSLFLRRIEVGTFGSVVGGVLFAMSGFLAVSFIWPMLLGSAIWLPLMLMWIDRQYESGCGLVTGPLLFALPILSGFFEIAFYAFVACALYTVVAGIRLIVQHRSPRPCLAFFARVAFAAVMAAVLAAPQLLPFLEVARRNVRAGELTCQAAMANRLTPCEALLLLVPDALGNPAKHTYLDLQQHRFMPIRAANGDDFFYFGPKNYVSSGFYFGVLPAVLVVLGLRGRGRARVFFWILLAVSVALAFGTPLYRLFYYLVPGSDQIRTPFRWMFLATFAGIGLAAAGAQRWHNQLGEGPTRRSRAIGAMLMALAVVLCVAVLVLLWAPAPLESFAARLLHANKRAASVFGHPSELAGWIWTSAFRFTLLATAAAACVTLGYWRAWRPRGAAMISLGLIVLVAVDLGQANYDFNTHADPALLDRRPPVIAYLESQASHDLFRIGRFGWQKVLYANLPILYGLQDYGGYDSIILGNFARFMQAIEPQKLLPYNIIMTIERKASLDSPLFRLLNIRYLLATDPINHPDWQQVDVPGPLRLYRVREEKALPRAFLVGHVESVSSLDDAILRLKSGDVDPARSAVVEAPPSVAAGLADPTDQPDATVAIEQYRRSTVRLHTSADRGKFLVLCDIDYPGWRVYVDGAQRDILVTDGVFRGVSVPAGNHTVEFRFEPRPLRIGLGLCLAGGGVLALLGLLGLRYRLKLADALHCQPISSKSRGL